MQPSGRSSAERVAGFSMTLLPETLAALDQTKLAFRGSYRTVLLLALVLSAVGCANSLGLKSAASYDPISRGGRENPKSDDPWVREAGSFARATHPSERVDDPLGLRKYFTSEKAREIERNVGVGD